MADVGAGPASLVRGSTIGQVGTVAEARQRSSRSRPTPPGPSPSPPSVAGSGPSKRSQDLNRLELEILRCSDSVPGCSPTAPRPQSSCLHKNRNSCSTRLAAGLCSSHRLGHYCWRWPASTATSSTAKRRQADCSPTAPRWPTGPWNWCTCRPAPATWP